VLFTVVLLALTGPIATKWSPSCQLADDRVERAISRKARDLDGHEYCQFRRYDAIDDFDGDHLPDLVVTFNIEGSGGGGNHVVSYLFAFLSSRPRDSGPLEAPAGDRGTFWTDDISSDGKQHIVLHVAKWLRGDALCCPSGSGNVLLVVDSRRGLVRVKADD
jgi:hypothetical protein